MRDIVYICSDCGEKFALNECGVFNDNGEEISVCPSCGSHFIDEAKRCKVCREIYSEYTERGGVCAKCFEDALSAWKTCISYLQPWEREALDNEYGNIDITEE
jgi:DNA-directed RNA polymerase subunit RPC12/RpoP